MQKVQKKINYCRLSLHNGICSQMELSEDHYLTGTGGGYFSYLAPVFDTMEYSCTFHRFIMHGNFKDCKFEVLVAAADKDISESIFEEGITPKDQEQILKTLKYVRKVNTHDFLLHDLEGRFLWIMIGVSASRADSRFVMEGFEVEYPRSSFVEYLPEIYHNEKDTFFYRYMAALQSLYENLEIRISDIPWDLDYETTRDENLSELAGWVGINEARFPYTSDQLRELIASLQEIQTGKGTKKILVKMLRMLTGKNVYVIEHFKWYDWMEESSQQIQDFARLYGADQTVFTVIVDFRNVKPSEIPERRWLQEWIREYTPLGMLCNLVYLGESNHMDTHCYLNVNSYLSTPTHPDTKGFVLGGNYVLG